jgi:hypothetical protein
MACAAGGRERAPRSWVSIKSNTGNWGRDSCFARLTQSPTGESAGDGGKDRVLLCSNDLALTFFRESHFLLRVTSSQY